MNPFIFAEWLHEAMEGTKSPEKRRIIRFSNNHDFMAFTNHIQRQRNKLPLLDQIQPLRLIHAISCTLPSADKIASAPFIDSIETDIRIKVHAVRKSANSVPPAKDNPASGSANIPWGVKHIRAHQAWSKSQGDRVRIGVIDTGVDYTHQDLRHCLSHGVNILNRQLLPIDDNGHGTHIAGTIAAYNRQHGIIGVAPLAVIHPVKAFDHQGGAFVSDIISGIDWCLMNNVNIINMSFGMKSYSRALESAVLSAYRAGIVIVASSGNEGRQSEVDYPARMRQVIAVGATTRKGKIAPFCNTGKEIDIYAPGEKIYSTWLRGKYHELSGTSMATSHVTGVIALMLARKPDLKPIRIKALLQKHARLIIRRGKQTGGIKEIHAFRAIAAVTK